MLNELEINHGMQKSARTKEEEKCRRSDVPIQTSSEKLSDRHNMLYLLKMSDEEV